MVSYVPGPDNELNLSTLFRPVLRVCPLTKQRHGFILPPPSGVYKIAVDEQTACQGLAPLDNMVGFFLLSPGGYDKPLAGASRTPQRHSYFRIASQSSLDNSHWRNVLDMRANFFSVVEGTASGGRCYLPTSSSSSSWPRPTL